MIDSIIFNAKIHTMDNERPFAEAMAISEDKIFAIGSNVDILAMSSESADKIDAGNRLILPGFIDCHLHLLEGSERLSQIKLRDAKSKHEFQQIFIDSLKSHKKGEWILGGDWNNENWGGELPEREWIDHITPHNPVWVKRLDGHMGLANSAALNFCGISEDLSPISGGEIFFRNGKSTGIFKDKAMELIESKLPIKSMYEKLCILEKGMDYLLERGVCSVHHLNLFESTDIELLNEVKRQEKLKTRIYASFPIEQADKLESYIRENGLGDEWIKFGLLKAFLDGSLGSQTAMFFSNYKGTSKNGLFVTDPEKLHELMLYADSKGFQLAVHAIGNKANNWLLNTLNDLNLHNGQRDRRFRIEHAQHMIKSDIQRINQLGAIASMQPLHLSDDGCWASKILENEALEGSFVFNDLVKSGARLGFGSDWFVAEPSPLLGIYAAATRQTNDGKNPDGWIPEQKIPVYEAIKAYTINAAYASFEENIKGSLSIGKLADFVMLSDNILEINAQEIKNTKVLWTVVGGKTQHQNF